MNKLNNSFLFWVTLAFVNLLTLSFVYKTGDKFTCTIASCMLFFSFAKALKIASESDKNER